MRIVGVIGLLVALVSSNSFAADANGYTARYECRAGGLYCNVDVQGLAGPGSTCDQTITMADGLSTIESKLNGANQRICIEPGDYTGLGRITVRASGSAGAHKVLRYYRSGDTDDDPWNQSNANQAKIQQLWIEGSYWIVHRLTFPPTNGMPGGRVASRNQSTHHIFNRLLVEGNGPPPSDGYYGYTQDCTDNKRYSNLTVQNSVFRNGGVSGPPSETIAIDLQCGDNFSAVNNECYDWVSHCVQVGNDNRPTNLNTVVENNDFYITSRLYTDCNGNYTPSNPDSPCAPIETVISSKAKATAGNHTKYVHNRLWGARATDLNLCCNGTSGALIGNYDNNDYMLMQNNIFLDAQIGINNSSTLGSFIGNLFYKIRPYNTSQPSRCMHQWHHASRPDQHNYERYLNTCIYANQTFIDGGDANVDDRCNVHIASGSGGGGSPLASSIADYNAFYGSTVYSFNGTDRYISEDLHTISGPLCTSPGCPATANTTGRSVGDIVRTSTDPAACTSANDRDCFLYKVLTVGTSGSVQAVRGPYVFWRRLKTDPEQVIIPYAVPYSTAPEAFACPGDFLSRAGIGVAD